MNNCVVSRRGYVGFGMNQEEAERDWLINFSAGNITAPEAKSFYDRRLSIRPWLPKENILHLKGIGCLKYEKPWLIECRTGNKVLVNNFNHSIYYYLANTLGNSIDYEDIKVTFREELNKFFRNILDSFVLLEDYPNIMCLNGNNGLSTNIAYKLDNQIIIGIGSDYIGLKFVGDEWYYSIDRNEIKDILSAVSYLAYRAGIVITEEGEVRYESE